MDAVSHVRLLPLLYLSTQLDNPAMDTDIDLAGVGPSRQVRILLVDDSPVERMALGHFIRRQGYMVDEAEDGRSALAHLQNREIDLLLLDLQMPEMSGFEVLGYLQQHRRGLPVILLSGMPVDQIQLSMHGLPTQELPVLFLKPVDLDQLMSLIELQLSGQLPDLDDSPSDSAHQT
jgi:CheY-like chemotaxis protein